jgi:hypothetical protein
MSTVNWDDLKLDDFNPNSLSIVGKAKIGQICHNFGKWDNFLLQVVLLTIMVHQLAIIYNAERAIDIASISNKCLGAPAESIISQCNIAIWAARVGFGFAALMLLLARITDSWNEGFASTFKSVFGVGILIPFIISLACASIAKGKTGNCTATQPPNQIGNPVEELNSVLGYMVNWSAIGMTASLLWCIFYIYRAVTGSKVSAESGAAAAGEVYDAASAKLKELSSVQSESSSVASSPTSSTA